MTNYSSNLTAWGASGSEYPSGYSYIEGEQPVDAWDNFFNSNVYTDVDHLINLTNERLDSTRSSAQPTSPTAGEQWYDPDNGQLGYYDDVGAAWKTVATRDWVLNESSLANADTLDGYDSSEFAVRAENETIPGDWTFDGSNTFNKAIDIYAKYSHVDMYESDNSNKQWRFEVNAGEFRVTEVGVDEQLAIAPGGFVDMPGGASLGADTEMNNNVLKNVHAIQSGETSARININAGASDLALQSGGSGTGRVQVWDNANTQPIAQFNEGGGIKFPNGDLETRRGWMVDSDTPRTVHVSSTDPGGENGDIWLKPN